MINSSTVPDDLISSKIYFIRDYKIMIDSDLSELYQVKTKRLNEQVKRNLNRFPEDFMFQLTVDEWKILKSQNATSSWGGRRVPPYVFTEHGVLMLSSILNSERAIAVNIQIMRVFTKIRTLIKNSDELLKILNELEKKGSERDRKISIIFQYINKLEQENKIKNEQTKRNRIGYK
jgi:hypothetical protein